MRATSSWLSSLFGQRQFAKLAQTDTRADCLRVEPKLNQSGASCLAGSRESTVKILSSFNSLTIQAISAAESGKIRVGECRAADSRGIFAFLMHPDGSIHTVIDDEEDRLEGIMHGRGDLLPVHQETSVS